VKLAAIQMSSGPEVGANLACARELLKQASDEGAVLAALPENFPLMGLREADKLAAAEPEGSGPIQDFLRETAQRLKLWIISGTIPLAVTNEPRVWAASLVYDASGEVVGRYDKIHLFDVALPNRAESYRESAAIAPGSRAVVVDTPVGRVGLSVCYDMRFPELYRNLTAAGAEVLVMPAAFTASTGRAHWETLLRARAIENLCYVAAPAQTGMHANGRETYGDTLIIDYWGRVLARRARGAGVVIAEIDRTIQAQVRTGFPALTHRREFQLAVSSKA
jgi:nitrilase